MTDKKFLIQDVEYWSATFDALIRFYRETSVETEEDRSTKAVAAARLAGFAEAMSLHFSACVDTCVDTTLETSPDIDACIAAGERIYNGCELHTQALEDRAVKELN